MTANHREPGPTSESERSGVPIFEQDARYGRLEDVRAHLNRAAWLDGPGYWIAIAVLGALSIAALVSLAMVLTSGPASRAKWAYTAAAVAFLFSSAQAAPVLAFTTRRSRGYWGIPVRRAAELLSIAGLVSAPLVVLLLMQLPPDHGDHGFWFNWPGAPLVWDGLAVALLSVLGVVLVYVSSLPDLAARRDRHAPTSSLALGWSGTVRQWRVLNAGVTTLGALYFALYAYVHLLVVTDLAVSLVPEWHSAVLPLHHAVTGLQGGVAATLLVMALLRHFGQQQHFFGRDTFHETGKLLLILSTFYFYFIWSELLPLWYWRTPPAIWTLGLFMFGPYLAVFAVSLACAFVIPFLMLLYNPIRDSVAGTTIAAGIALVGVYADRVRLYVPSWSFTGPLVPRGPEMLASRPLPPT
ncbi:MAG TPA: hypothetical protein VGW38_10910, partial [Chloroflexota bacterium]|nr:hypothetical protein [Chloroflexota bacterium]